MSVKITIDVEGEQAVINAFQKVERGILDLRQLGTWKWVASEFYKVEKAQFGSEGSAGKSGKWKSLTSPYKEIKAKKWGDQPILQASGRLYKSLTANGADSVYEESNLELTLGSSLPYAGYHQKGTRKMAARPPISLNDEQITQITKPIQKKLEQLIDNAKLRDIRGF